MITIPDPETKYREFHFMKKYRCTICGYVYDPEEGNPENGILPGTSFEELPLGWVCPVCGAQQSEFEPAD
jgi:rubredoxin